MKYYNLSIRCSGRDGFDVMMWPYNYALLENDLITFMKNQGLIYKESLIHPLVDNDNDYEHRINECQATLARLQFGDQIILTEIK